MFRCIIVETSSNPPNNENENTQQTAAAFELYNGTPDDIIMYRLCGLHRSNRAKQNIYGCMEFTSTML